MKNCDLCSKHATYYLCSDRADELERNVTRLQKDRENLLEALESFKHADGCFCEAAFAMPGTIVSHSAECRAATVAIAKAKNEPDR